MNPLQYKALYHKLTVSLDELGITTVDVHHYKNNGAAYANDPLHRTVEAVRRKDLLNGQAIEGAGWSRKKGDFATPAAVTSVRSTR